MARRSKQPKLSQKGSGAPPPSSLGTTDQTPAASIGDGTQDITDSPVVTILNTYRLEAKSARESGSNPRDTKWRENLDLYWNRYDFSKKAPWQSQAAMPEVPQIVDRFAASIVEALAQGPNGGYYEIEDPADVEGDITKSIKKLMDIWLSEVGRTANGQPLDFLAASEPIIKLGCLMNLCASVVWKDLPGGGGYTALEPVDPRTYWVDHTGRMLYRVRRLEIDKAEMMRMAQQQDKKGKGIYDLAAIEGLAAYMRTESQDEKRRLSGSGVEEASNRKTITLDEYLGTIINHDGKVMATNSIAVIANEKFLIRPPEPNPNWHGKDWILYVPFCPVPLSVYGRGYMENMGSVARLYTDMTNLLMDAAYTSSMKAFIGDLSQLEDPTQLANGLSPNLFLKTGEDLTAQLDNIIHTLDLGAISPEVVQLWQTVKDELREAGSFNELTAGGLAPKGRTSSAEIQSANQNGSIMLRSVARIIEQQYVEPSLDLIWKTNLQHMKPNDQRLINAVGQQQYAMLYANRKELIKRAYTFKCRGITRMLERQEKLKTMLSILGIMQQNQTLLQAFLQKVDPGRMVEVIFQLSDIDIDKLGLTPREQQMQAIMQQQQQMQAAMAEQAGAGGPAGPAGAGGGGAAPGSAPGGTIAPQQGRIPPRKGTQTLLPVADNIMPQQLSAVAPTG